MNLAKISTKVTFWSQEEEQLNSLVNQLLPRELPREAVKNIFGIKSIFEFIQQFARYRIGALISIGRLCTIH